MSYLMLRSLKQALYSVDNVGHFALAADTYTHFTSPIRRYPDLMVHRLLTAALDGRTCSSAPELSAVADESSQSERRAAEAERELVEWKKTRFMADRVGDEFDALIISLIKYGFFVELTDLFVEGFVALSTLGDDYYVYQERQRAIVGQHTHRAFHLGEQVRVRLDRIDHSGNKLEFSVAS